MKILVLGGAGYIGSHTVSELVDAGEDVVIADSLETGHIEAVNPKAKFYQGDIRDKKFIDSVFDNEKIDAVIHFAANSLVGESMTNPLKYYDNNLYGTKVLLQSMVEHDVKKIVFSSVKFGFFKFLPKLLFDTIKDFTFCKNLKSCVLKSCFERFFRSR